MQNRYVGDIGDDTKLAMLRALAPGRRLSVVWWLHPDSGPLGDGRHIDYLKRPDRWRHLDPDAFDALSRIVTVGDRKVKALETSGLLAGASWFSEEVPTSAPWWTRASRRLEWFGRVREAVDHADIVFVDPDNGLEPGTFNVRRKTAGKAVSIAELLELSRPGRLLIVYHHQTRSNGTHLEEIALLAGRLRNRGFASVDAIRARPSSARAFFLLNADAEVRSRAKALCARWTPHLSWHGGEK